MNESTSAAYESVRTAIEGMYDSLPSMEPTKELLKACEVMQMSWDDVPPARQRQLLGIELSDLNKAYDEVRQSVRTLMLAIDNDYKQIAGTIPKGIPGKTSTKERPDDPTPEEEALWQLREYEGKIYYTNPSTGKTGSTEVQWKRKNFGDVVHRWRMKGSPVAIPA